MLCVQSQVLYTEDARRVASSDRRRHKRQQLKHTASPSPSRVASRRVGFNVVTEDQGAVQVWDCWDMAAWTSRGRDEVTAHIADGVAIMSAARDGIATLNADGDGTAVDRERNPLDTSTTGEADGTLPYSSAADEVVVVVVNRMNDR